MDRLYQILISQHLKKYRQMAFLAGPRQVGKTTVGHLTAKGYQKSRYINWDFIEDRELISASRELLETELNLNVAQESPPLIFFDEIHKYRKWKLFLKGFFDLYEKRTKILVTGSARLNVYQAGGDSLMGRYFYYRMHPLSTGELVKTVPPVTEISLPHPIPDDLWEQLWNFGGFPEPLKVGEQAFLKRWQSLRNQQLFQEDLRDISQVQDIGQIHLLAEIIRRQAAQLTSYTQLAKKIQVTIPTVQRWLELLRSVYYLFAVKPWSKNITRSLLKEPKYFLWDWSLVEDPGARFENFIACHLLKSVHLWTDLGLGNYDLFFLRDRDKREVDFIVTKDDAPFFLVECKLSSSGKISKNLSYFQAQTKAPHAFQVELELEPIQSNCFEYSTPTIVSARTFLSQLV